MANSIAKPGKAPEHKKGNILPHHLLKPGAHPSHKDHGHEHDKNKKSHEEHAKKDHHDAKKAEANKDAKKNETSPANVTAEAKLPSPQKIK